MLPLSHDEVVYGKQSIIGRMPGDEWQRFANLRLLYGYMYTHPGTKLLFMGGEFGQTSEWNFQQSLDWHLLQYDVHKGVLNMFKDLNQLYKTQPALYEKAFSAEGFEWLHYGDAQNSVLTYMRKGHDPENDLVILCNFTPNTFNEYVIGLPRKTQLQIIFNSDDKSFGGSGYIADNKIIKSKKLTEKWHGKEHGATLKVPPLAVVVYKML